MGTHSSYRGPAVSCSIQAALRLTSLLRVLPALVVALTIGSATLRADLSSGTVAVYSSISPDYKRSTQSDGSYKPETYAFGEGGDWGGPMKDASIDTLRFIDIARQVAPSLAAQNYVPETTRDPKKTELLIMVYWGTTSGFLEMPNQEYASAQALVPPPLHKPTSYSFLSDFGAMASSIMPKDSSAMQEYKILKAANVSAMQNSWSMINAANRSRDRRNFNNAAVLGYLSDLKGLNGLKGTPLGLFRQDILDEVEENRYFVVLLAYDFQLLWKHKQRKLLWETRFNIRQRGNDFDKELGSMAKIAARYFGKDSGGLIRKSFTDAKVTLGEAKFLGFEPEQKN